MQIYKHPCTCNPVHQQSCQQRVAGRLHRPRSLRPSVLWSATEPCDQWLLGNHCQQQLQQLCSCGRFVQWELQ